MLVYLRPIPLYLSIWDVYDTEKYNVQRNFFDNFFLYGNVFKQ